MDVAMDAAIVVATVWIARCVGLSLIFVLVALIVLIVLIGLVALILLLHLIARRVYPFVSLAVDPHLHNLNIANIQTSPNKKVDNILFSFILLALESLHWPKIKIMLL